MMNYRVSRRTLLRQSGLVASAVALGACTPEVVEKVVKETVIVAGTPQVVERVVTATPEPVKPQEAVTIRYSTWMGPPRLQYIEQIMESFQAEFPLITVQLEQLSWGDYWDKVQVEFAAGAAPDVFWGSGSYFVNFVQKNVLLDTTPYIERDGIDMDGYYSQENVITWDGLYYGMPMGTGGVVLYYNEDLFDEAGLDYPTEEWTWDDVRLAAEALTKDTNGDDRMDQWGIQVNNNSESGWGPFVLSNGGQWISDDYTKMVIDSEESIQAMEWVIANICELGLQARSGEVTLPPGVSDSFAGGILGMYIGGTWNIRLYKTIGEFGWDIAPVPISPNTQTRMTTYNANPNWGFAGTQYPEEAWTLLKYFASEEAQRIIGEGEIKIPQLKSVANDITGYAGPPPEHKRYALELFDYGHDLWFHERSAEMGSVMTAELDYAFLCEKSAREACVAAAEAGDRVLTAV
jgi:multiple sugar transport system substrate-binding protein